MEESRRSRKKRETKAKILKTAMRIFADKGYENASVEDIADEVDISKATFFNYFPNKESLLLGIADEQREEFEVYFEKMNKTDISSVKKIIAVVEWVYFDSIKYLNLNSRIAYTCFPKNGESIPCTYRSIKHRLTDLVKSAVENGELYTELSSDEIVRVILVSCCGLIFDSYYSGKKYGARKKFNLAVEVLLKGIGYKNDLKGELINDGKEKVSCL